MARLGIYYVRKASFDISNLKIGGRRVRLSLPPEERQVLEHELGTLLIEDCYRLNALKERETRQIESVLDVGANVGLFGITARHHFPGARIHMYEPNSNLEPYLKHHAERIGAEWFQKAVGAEAGAINLQLSHGSMYSVAHETAGGTVQQIAFREAIERLGGKVDLVKLDCEGAEWPIFKDVESWRNVRHLTMEYHLWADPGYVLEDLFQAIDRIGFRTWHHEPDADGQWGLLQASNTEA